MFEAQVQVLILDNVKSQNFTWRIRRWLCSKLGKDQNTGCLL